MLKKLIKYDLKWLLKVIVIFLVLGTAFSVIGRLFQLIPDSIIFDIISKICKGTAISLLISAIINTIMRGWVRTTTNLYKDESYLTHTLPIERKTHFLSKVISITIIMILSFLVLFANLFIMYYSKENMEMLKQALNLVSSTLDSSISGVIIVMLVVITLEVLFLVFCGLFGIVLGHRFNEKKILKSLLFGLMVYGISSTVSLVVMIFASLFSTELQNLLFNSTQVTVMDMSLFIYILWGCAVIYLVYCLVLYFITSKIFNKGVNVD